jgi:hypothetical protein
MLRLILTLMIVLGTSLASAAQTASAMLEATRTFLATLDSAQKAKAMLPFNSEERFLPRRLQKRNSPKEMNPEQQRAPGRCMQV